MYMQENPETGYLTALSETPDGPIVTNLVGVHKVTNCVNHPCVIHGTATLHPLTMEPAFWNNDMVCIERVCAHGQHHPDKDNLEYFNTIGGFPYEHTAHLDCDGCCVGEYK